MLRRKIVVQDVFGIDWDPAFAGVLGALDPYQMEQAMRSLTGQSAEIVAINVVRHKPGKRCLIEYTLASGGRLERVLGKVRVKGLDWRAYETQLACWRAGLSVPEPLGLVPELRMWVQRRVPGRDLMSHLLDAGRVNADVMRDTADLIFELHRSAVPVERSHGMSAELAILHERLRGLACERPTLSGRIARLLLAIEQAAARVQAGRMVGIHRDFYPDQVVAGPDGLWLVDLDLYARGDAALDIGNFSGHLIELGVRCFGDPGWFVPEQRAFESRYLERAGEGLRGVIDVFTTLALARHIQLSTQFPERRHTTMPLLELCEERLRHAQG